MNVVGVLKEQSKELDMTWKDFLNKCNEAYSLGEVYVTTFDDVECIKRDTGIVLEELSPVSDRIYDQVYYKCKELYPTDSLFQALTSVNTGYGVDIEKCYKTSSFRGNIWDKFFWSNIRNHRYDFVTNISCGNQTIIYTI